MAKPNISQLISELIEPLVSQAQLELVDIEYKKEGKNWLLRVYIDKKGGLSVDDCQKLSRQIEDVIDIDEALKSSYILEVSSPGLDRPLKREKDFLRNKGKQAKVVTYSPINNQKDFSGTINDFKDRTLLLDNKGTLFKIPLDAIAQAKLVIEL